MLGVVVRRAGVFVHVEAGEPARRARGTLRSFGSDSPCRLKTVSPSPLCSQSNMTGNSL